MKENKELIEACFKDMQNQIDIVKNEYKTYIEEQDEYILLLEHKIDLLESKILLLQADNNYYRGESNESENV